MVTTLVDTPVDEKQRDDKTERHMRHMARRFEIYQHREQALRESRRALMSRHERLITTTLRDVVRFFVRAIAR